MAYIGTSPANGVRRKHTYTATAGQTSFSGADDNNVTLTYVDTEYLDVYQNGVKLVAVSDYASTTGTSVVLVQGASVDDTVEIIVFDVFSVADTVSAGSGGSFGGNIGIGGTLAVTGETTLATHLNMGDGDIIKLGASADLQIYHDGSQSYIQDTGTGSLMLSGSQVNMLNAARNAYMLQATEGAGVTLNFNNVARLAAITDGVTTTGINRTNADAANAYAMYVHNDGNNVNRYGISISSGTDDASGTNYSIGFKDGNDSSIGAITFSGGTVTYGAFTAFHPCIIPNADNDADSTDNAYPYGTLLEISSLSYKQKNDADTERGLLYNVQKSSSAKSKAVIGAYGSSMNGGPDEETNMHQTLILGDGHILCNNENGNIAIGDYICTSSASGEGMKATSICTTIGVAREAVSFTNSTAVLVAVEYGYRQFVPEDLEARITALENA